MELPDKWTKASVIGSLWAANEIILGSFLHNLQVPFSGTVLAFMSVALLVAFSRVWKEKGMILRAGLICAVMKSLSPSAIILGPMTGIILEALFLEMSIRIMGRTLPGYLAGGALAVVSVLVQKIVKLLVLFGSDLVQVGYNFYQYVAGQLGMENTDPWAAVGLIFLIYSLAGTTAAWLGYYAGGKVNIHGQDPRQFNLDALKGELFKKSAKNTYHSWLILIHISAIIFLLFALSETSLRIAVIPSLLYIILTILWYRSSLRHLKKPVFWIQLLVLTFLASVFWNGFSGGNLWDREGILVGLTMNVRAAVLLMGFSAISVELRNPFIRTILYERGMKNFYMALELAFTALPAVIDSLPSSREILRKPLRSISVIIGKAVGLLHAFEASLSNLPQIIIITGTRKQGKTTLIREVTERLKSSGVQVTGFLSEAIHEKGQRIGYRIQDVRTSEKYDLCSIRRSDGSELRIGKYYFDTSTIARGINILNQKPEDTEAYIIDEVGPMELGGGGWAPALDEITKQDHPLMIWTVRPGLVSRVTLKWPAGRIRVFEAGSADAAEIARLAEEWLSTGRS